MNHSKPLDAATPIGGAALPFTKPPARGIVRSGKAR